MDPNSWIHLNRIHIVGCIATGRSNSIAFQFAFVSAIRNVEFWLSEIYSLRFIDFFCHHALSSYYWLNFMRGLFFSKGINFNVFKPERANTLEPFYFKANLGTRFWVGFDNQAFCQLFCAPFKMTLKINQERRKRRLFKGLKIVGHRIV